MATLQKIKHWFEHEYHKLQFFPQNLSKIKKLMEPSSKMECDPCSMMAILNPSSKSQVIKKLKKVTPGYLQTIKVKVKESR